MLADKLKQGKALDFDKTMKAYITKNYDQDAYNQVQSFIVELQQCRNTLIKLNEVDKGYESLKKTKDNLIEYLQYINLLKSKMNFGTDQFSLKFEFSWKDVLKNDSCTSNNINFEYYNNLFNLAVCYNLLGTSISINNEEELKLKESIKYFQHAAWLFECIKNEINSNLNSKEIPSDMTDNYLTYVI
jgi:hypothetical protein